MAKKPTIYKLSSAEWKKIPEDYKTLGRNDSGLKAFAGSLPDRLKKQAKANGDTGTDLVPIIISKNIKELEERTVNEQTRRMFEINNVLNEAKNTDAIKLLDNLNASTIDVHSAVVKLDEWTYGAEPGAMPQKNVRLVADLRKAVAELQRVVHRSIAQMDVNVDVPVKKGR